MQTHETELLSPSSRAISAPNSSTESFRAPVSPPSANADLIQTDTAKGLTPDLQTFRTFASTEALIAYKDDEIKGIIRGKHEYSRYGNRTQVELEEVLANLDHGEEAALFPSGMGAITTTIGALLANLDGPVHIVASGECYRKTRQFFEKDIQARGCEVTFVPPHQLREIEGYLRPDTKIIFIESPSNPYLRVTDLRYLSRIAREQNIITIVDSTFATPINQRPKQFGIDLVIHSLTKYLSGENDILGGVVIGDSSFIRAIKDRRGMLGCVSSPEDAAKLLSRVPLYSSRVLSQNEKALKVASYLEAHPRIRRVWYPLLSSHPDFATARAQLRGAGGVISFEYEGDLLNTGKFLNRIVSTPASRDGVAPPVIGASFGGQVPQIQQPAIMSFYSYSVEERRKLGIPDNLARLSVGAGSADPLIAQFEAALNIKEAK